MQRILKPVNNIKNFLQLINQPIVSLIVFKDSMPLEEAYA